jgi:hypothetical protein
VICVSAHAMGISELYGEGEDSILLQRWWAVNYWEHDG